MQFYHRIKSVVTPLCLILPQSATSPRWKNYSLKGVTFLAWDLFRCLVRTAVAVGCFIACLSGVAKLFYRKRHCESNLSHKFTSLLIKLTHKKNRPQLNTEGWKFSWPKCWVLCQTNLKILKSVSSFFAIRRGQVIFTFLANVSICHESSLPSRAYFCLYFFSPCENGLAQDSTPSYTLIFTHNSQSRTSDQCPPPGLISPRD